MEEVVVVVVEVAVAVAAHHLQRDEREAARPRDEQREHAQLLREHQRSEPLACRGEEEAQRIAPNCAELRRIARPLAERELDRLERDDREHRERRHRVVDRAERPLQPRRAGHRRDRRGEHEADLRERRPHCAHDGLGAPLLVGVGVEPRPVELEGVARDEQPDRREEERHRPDSPFD